MSYKKASKEEIEAAQSRPGEQSPFCEKAERVGLRCQDPCTDSICFLKGKEQRRYRGYDLHDTVTIYTPKKGGGLIIDTDIEVAFPVPAGKRSMGIKGIMQDKQNIVTMELGPGLRALRDAGVVVSNPSYHQHYNPNRLPEIGALHVHVSSKADTMAEAKRLAEQLMEVVDAKRLEELVE